MCEYCGKNKILKSCNFAGSGRLTIHKTCFKKNVGLLELQGDGIKAKIFRRLYCPRFEINYCPICGRKLGD